MTQAFISYVRADEDSAKRLADELERRGVHVTWLDQLVTPGESWVARLQAEIARSDLFFVLVSSKSEKSQWVASETALALSNSEHGRPRVVPVLLHRAASLPSLLQSIQGIELFDIDRSRKQLDALVESVKLPDSTPTEQSARARRAELTSLMSSRRSLQDEIKLQASARAMHSASIAALVGALITVTAIVAVGAFLAKNSSHEGGLSDAPTQWVVPFGLGALASVAGLLASKWIRRRLIVRDGHKDSK